MLNRRSIYNRYVDPTGGRQTQEDSNRQLMLLPPPAPPTPPPPVLQITQSNNTNSSNNKLEESGGAKHIDPKLIEMITSEVMEIFISKDIEESASRISARQWRLRVVVRLSIQNLSEKFHRTNLSIFS